MTSLLREDLQSYQPASNLAFNERVKAVQRSGVEVAHFGFGQSPFPIPAPFVDGLRKYAHRHEYLSSAGLLELREAVLDFHLEWDGVESVSVEDVVIAPGSKELLFLTGSVFGGDMMLVSPAWTTYEPQTVLGQKKQRCHILHSRKEDAYKLTPELIESEMGKKEARSDWNLLIFNNPNNPSGQAYSELELQALTQSFRKHKILVMSDEIYGRLQWDEEFVSLARLYPEGTILFSGFSKWASAGGWRAGYALFPPELRELCRAVQSAGSHTFTCAPTPIQLALAHGLAAKEEIKDYVEKSKKILHWVGDYCHRTLNAAEITSNPPQGGYYLMADFERLRDGLNRAGITKPEDMCEALLSEARVAVMPCGGAHLRPDTELTTRFCFINFDGQAAFQGLADTPELKGDAFVEHYCTPTVVGVKRLVSWAEKYMEK